MSDRFFWTLWLAALIGIIAAGVLGSFVAMEAVAAGVLFWIMSLKSDLDAAWQAAAKHDLARIQLEETLAKYQAKYGPMDGPHRRSILLDVG